MIQHFEYFIGNIFTALTPKASLFALDMSSSQHDAEYFNTNRIALSWIFLSSLKLLDLDERNFP